MGLLPTAKAKVTSPVTQPWRRSPLALPACQAGPAVVLAACCLSGLLNANCELCSAPINARCRPNPSWEILQLTSAGGMNYRWDNAYASRGEERGYVTQALSQPPGVNGGGVPRFDPTSDSIGYGALDQGSADLACKRPGIHIRDSWATHSLSPPPSSANAVQKQP